jgi:hypothetical protein
MNPELVPSTSTASAFLPFTVSSGWLHLPKKLSCSHQFYERVTQTCSTVFNQFKLCSGKGYWRSKPGSALRITARCCSIARRLPCS